MKSIRGFTLIEITIVVTIIALLGTIFIANYRGGEKQFALKRSAHKLAQDLRTAQEMAMSSQTTPDSFELNTFPNGGYGIYFAKGSNSYILFADCDGNGVYSEPGSAPTCVAATTSFSFWKGEKLEEFYLEEGIYIKEVLKDSTSLDSLSLTIFPPDPTTIINSDVLANSAIIYLTFDGQSEKVISINKAGLIDIK